MVFLQVLIFLLFCAVALGWIARRLRLPYPIALVIGGGVLGFVPGLPEVEFDPQLLLVIVLPPVLYQAALLTSWRDFKSNLRPIGMLAIGLVVVTTLAVGAALKLAIPGIPWAVAFAFGAIVSPPDAVAATAILSSLHMPRRIVTVLEGESLVNDASGLVLYKFAVAAALTGAFSLGGAGLDFVWVAAAGVAIGVACAWVFVRVHGWLGDPFTEVLVALAIPWIAYLIAESAHVSGVLAVVAAGLFRGRFAPKIVSAEMRINARSVWNILVFLLNSLVFVLMGMQLSGIVGRIEGFSGAELAVLSLWVSAVAVAVRFAWVYPTAFVYRWLQDRSPSAPRASEAKQLFIVSWCGMRGIVSLAAALALPVQVHGGAPFPYRDLVVFLTFVVIAVTLVGQGLTLAPLIRRLGVGSDEAAHEEARHARDAIGRAAIEALDRAEQAGAVDPAIVERLRAEFAERISDSPVGGAAGEAARHLRLAAIRAGRRALIASWQAGRISDDVLHQLEEELDHQESRL